MKRGGRGEETEGGKKRRKEMSMGNHEREGKFGTADGFLLWSRRVSDEGDMAYCKDTLLDIQHAHMRGAESSHPQTHKITCEKFW